FVSVVEPSGRATILDATDGRPLVEQPIVRQQALEEIHLETCADAFLVVTDHRPSRPSERMVRPFNQLESTLVTGELYLFGRATGQMRWSRPAEVSQAPYLTDQPADLPFIAFAGLVDVRKRTPSATDRAAGRTTTTILILDKATGRTLYSADD